MRYVHFIIQYVTCPHIESFVRGGQTLTTFFPWLMREGRFQIPLKAGHHWPACNTPLNAGLVAL